MADDEEYDMNGPKQDDKGYKMSAVLNKLDSRLANYPHTAVKYIHDDLDLANLTWKQRADFEFYLLNYNVNRNADLATGADMLMTVFKTRNIGNALKGKKGFRDVIVAICALVLIIALVAFIIGLLLILVFNLAKMPREAKIAGKFIFSTVMIILVMTVVIFVSNSIMTRIAITESMAK